MGPVLTPGYLKNQKPNHAVIKEPGINVIL